MEEPMEPALVDDGAVPLRIELESGPDETVLRASGDLDLDTAPELLAVLKRAAAKGSKRLVVDCAGVQFLDSAGLRALLEARQELEPTTVVVVANPSEAVSRILELTRLRDELMP